MAGPPVVTADRLLALWNHAPAALCIGSYQVGQETGVREALESLFPKPFTDYQWSAISAQGYEGDLVSGARGVEEVARELKDLMEAASRIHSGSDSARPTEEEGTALTWDWMERLVLGRILLGQEPAAASPHSGSRLRRLAAERRRERRLWRTLLTSVVAVLAVGAAAVSVFWAPRCDGGAAPAETSLTAGTSLPGVQDWDLSVSGTTLPSFPPATIPALALPDYTALLSGDLVVPPVDTQATGVVDFDLSDDGISMEYLLKVQEISDLTVARLRLGGVESSGEEIFTLYTGPTKRGPFTGIVADWSFTAADFKGPLRDKSMSDLIALIEAGSVYVEVETIEHRDGELRGQLL